MDSIHDAGSVTILYGSSLGLTKAGARLWTLNSPGIAGDAQIEDRFGWSLAVGNFGKTTHSDLAIGIRNKQKGTAFAAGAVAIIYGSVNGLNANGSQFWTQDSTGILDVAE